MLLNPKKTHVRVCAAATALALVCILPVGAARAQDDAAQAPAIRITPSVPVEMTDAEAEYWQDPDFRRRFVESYIAETDIEPKASTQEEIDAINNILALMSVPTKPVLDEDGEPVEGEDGAVREEPVEEAPEQVVTRLQGALEAALDARENETYSALIDFLVANLYLNIAMNLPEPVEPDKPGPDAGEQAAASYEQAFEAYEAKLAAREQEHTKMLEASAKYYGRATVKHPKYRRAWRNLGLVNIRLKDFDEARIAFAKVITLGGGDPDTYGLMGYCFTSLGKHLPAESAYRMANMLDPEQVSWEMGLIRSFLLQKRYPEAIALTGRLLEDDPTNEQLWLFQANAYIGMDEIDKALKNYEILHGLGKSSVDSVSLLANIYTNKGMYDTAVDYYRQAIAMAKPNEAEGLRTQLLRAARVLSTRGASASGATQALIGAIEAHFGEGLKDEDLKEMLMLKARMAVAEGDSAQEAKILEDVIALDPLDGEALLLLGQYHARQYKRLDAESSDPEAASSKTARNHLDQAVLYFERAQNLEDADIVADAYVRHAQVEVAAGRPEKAVPLLKKAESIKPRESVASYLEAVERMRK